MDIHNSSGDDVDRAAIGPEELAERMERAERIALAMLADAAGVFELFAGQQLSTRGEFELYEETHAWIFSDARDGFNDFLNVCETAGKSPSRFRKQVKAMVRRLGGFPVRRRDLDARIRREQERASARERRQRLVS